LISIAIFIVSVASVRTKRPRHFPRGALAPFRSPPNAAPRGEAIRIGRDRRRAYDWLIPATDGKTATTAPALNASRAHDFGGKATDMGTWLNLIIIIAVVVLPALSRVLQTIAEKQQEKRARERRAGRGGSSDAPSSSSPSYEAADTGYFGQSSEAAMSRGSDETLMTPSEEARRGELARRRQAQLEAWRARQRREAQSAYDTTRSPGTPSRDGGGRMIEGQSGESVIRDAFEPMRPREAAARRRPAPPSSQRPQPSASPSTSSTPDWRITPGQSQVEPVPPPRDGAPKRPRPEPPPMPGAEEAAIDPGARRKREAMMRLHKARVAKEQLEAALASGTASAEQIEAWAVAAAEEDPYRIMDPDEHMRRERQALRSMANSPQLLRRAFILKELLDPPIAVRDTHGQGYSM